MCYQPLVLKCTKVHKRRNQARFVGCMPAVWPAHFVEMRFCNVHRRTT